LASEQGLGAVNQLTVMMANDGNYPQQVTFSESKLEQKY
jgi:hypothetical protein